jgi:glycosyltransferase involved in cell wall biosynthesis
MKPITVFVPLPPSYRGGTEEYAYRVAARIAEVWPLRIVTTTVRWSPGADVLPTGRATVEFLRAREIFQRPLITSRASRRRIRELVGSSSLVQVHMPFPRVERWVARWGAEAGIPTVFTYHMDADFGAATGRRSAGIVTSAYRGLSARPALRAATAVVSNSRGYANASPVLRNFPDKIHAIAKGIDPGRFGLGEGHGSSPTFDVNARWADIRPPAKRLLFVGRLVPYKGLSVLIEAVHRLQQRGNDLRLFIAGRGPEESRLKTQVAARGLQEVVRFLGFVPDPELASLYRGADVAVCPSLSLLESTPTSLEEATALGVPIVGSSLPGADEALPNDGVRGLLTPPGDVEALAQALERMTRVPRPSPPAKPRTWVETAEDYQKLMAALLPPDRDSARNGSS